VNPQGGVSTRTNRENGEVGLRAILSLCLAQWESLPFWGCLLGVTRNLFSVIEEGGSVKGSSSSWGKGRTRACSMGLGLFYFYFFLQHSLVYFMCTRVAPLYAFDMQHYLKKKKKHFSYALCNSIFHNNSSKIWIRFL
jgi:hypothetical protein